MDAGLGRGRSSSRLLAGACCMPPASTCWQDLPAPCAVAISFAPRLLPHLPPSPPFLLSCGPLRDHCQIVDHDFPRLFHKVTATPPAAYPPPCPLARPPARLPALQILDHYFGNVCELDLVFGFHKVYCILDEFIIGGEIQETSKKVILERIKELDALEG